MKNIAVKDAQVEQKISQYRITQETGDKLLTTRQESAISVYKAPNENFLQSVCNEIAAEADRDYLFEMEIRRHMMLTEGIET
jgi:uncharacterized protein YaaR (DUF327 family)